jgi:hypothetical protein
MSGQSAAMSRSEVISMSRKIEYGPNATKSGSNDPNSGKKEGMSVKVPTSKGC